MLSLAAVLLAASLAAPSEAIPARRNDALEARVTGCRPLLEVRSASGLARRGEQFVVLQDDYAQVAFVDPRSARASGDPRAGGALPKPEKPDWEAAFTGGDGALYIVGSGASPKRRRIDRLSPEGERSALPVEKLYLAIEAALGAPPNLEGAVPLGPRVRLFHRGSGGRPSATVDVPLAALLGGEAKVAPPRFYRLGAVGGSDFQFTDAARLRGERILFLAAAEDTPDAVTDGALLGSTAGVLEGDQASWTPLREEDGKPTVRKFEGVLLEDGAGWVVSDADDDAVPSELCRLELRGPW